MGSDVLVDVDVDVDVVVDAEDADDVDADVDVGLGVDVVNCDMAVANDVTVDVVCFFCVDGKGTG